MPCKQHSFVAQTCKIVANHKKEWSRIRKTSVPPMLGPTRRVTVCLLWAPLWVPYKVNCVGSHGKALMSLTEVNDELLYVKGNYSVFRLLGRLCTASPAWRSLINCSPGSGPLLHMTFLQEWLPLKLHIPQSSLLCDLSFLPCAERRRQQALERMRSPALRKT